MTVLDGRTKGLPPGVSATTRRAIATAGYDMLREDLPLPLALLKASSLDHNAEWMKRFLELTGASLAPHAKTSMSPELIARQLADGAWAITVATVQQLRVCREHGISRLLLANQLVGRQAIAYVLDEIERDPRFEFFCLVDSMAGVDMLASAAKARGLARPVDLLLECGAMGARTGCRTLESAMALARHVAASAPWVRLAGVEGYEGAIHGKDDLDTERRVAIFVAFMSDVARHCQREALFGRDEIVLSAGGSAYFDLAAGLPRQVGGRAARVVLRAGCYLTHDSGGYAKAARQMRRRSPEIVALGAGLRDAIEVWSYVQSLPEPGLAILSMGKRDVAHDLALPLPQLAFRPGFDHTPRPLPGGVAITALNDQHAFMTTPMALAVGDMIGCTISHPCTTFDKWRFLPVVDDDYRVIDAVTTFF